MEFKGYIQVYTGNGKGKTTAALGLALRAAGRKKSVYMAQFMKKSDYGEHLAAAPGTNNPADERAKNSAMSSGRQ